MSNCNLTILSYHIFTDEENDYVFSRTYKQFRNDLETKDFDMITFDDATKGQIKAAKMMADLNYRAKIFVATSLIGKEGYCSWEDLWHLSKKHDIESHGHFHIKLSELYSEEIESNIETSVKLIKENTGRMPRYFVSPWNETDEKILQAAEKFKLNVLTNRIDMKNISR